MGDAVRRSLISDYPRRHSGTRALAREPGIHNHWSVSVMPDVVMDSGLTGEAKPTQCAALPDRNVVWRQSRRAALGDRGVGRFKIAGKSLAIE